jgi:S-formylglutathione hydrolase FrmB
MALCDLHWSSKTISKHIGTYVYIPDDAPPPFACFYLLHGLSDDYTIWLRRTSIERYALAHKLMIVMPDGFRGFYTDNAEGPAYARYIGEELLELIERTFPAKRARESRGIGGLSMGGYGALRLALGYPDLFAAASSHSGAVMHGSRNHPRAGGSLGKAEFHRIFGDDPIGTDHDILALARKVQAANKLPALRIDCGVDDDLIADNRTLHAKFDAMRIPHEYAEFPGGHNWDYWDVHVQEALAFQSNHLR